MTTENLIFNADGTMNLDSFRLTSHGKERIKQRKINAEEIYETVQKITIEEAKNFKNKKMPIWDEAQELFMVLKIQNNTFGLVTTYRKSKRPNKEDLVIVH